MIISKIHFTACFCISCSVSGVVSAAEQKNLFLRKYFLVNPKKWPVQIPAKESH